MHGAFGMVLEPFQLQKKKKNRKRQLKTLWQRLSQQTHRAQLKTTFPFILTAHSEGLDISLREIRPGHS